MADDSKDRIDTTDSQMGWMIGCFAIGAMAGALGALLLATQSGAETREDIRKGFTDMKEKLSDLTDQVKSRSKELADRGREIIDQQREALKAAVEAGREVTKKKDSSPAKELSDGGDTA